MRVIFSYNYFGNKMFCLVTSLRQKTATESATLAREQSSSSIVVVVVVVSEAMHDVKCHYITDTTQKRDYYKY